MPCCKAYKYKWCENLETINAPDGLEYCIFHAPEECDEKKGKDNLKSYNNTVKDYINISIGEKKVCNLSGSTFPDSISFGDFNKPTSYPGLNLRDATFKKDVVISNIIFTDEVSLIGVTVGGFLSITNSLFTKKFETNGASIKKNCIFVHMSANDLVDFRNTKINGGLWFSGSFDNDVCFQCAVIGGDVQFIDTYFRGTVRFGNVVFKKGANFCSINFCGVEFDSAVFSDKLVMSGCIVERCAKFISGTFRQEANFNESYFLEKVDFRDAQFYAYSKFIGTCFWGGVDFSSAFFENYAYFSAPILKTADFSGCITHRKIILERADVTQVPLTRVNLESFSFVSCTWPKDDRGLHIICDDASCLDPSILEDTYRRLKRVAGNDNDMPRMSDWHYREKLRCLEQIQRRNPGFSRWRNIFTVTWWYWFSSGFGERPARAICVLLCLLGLLLVALAGSLLYETGISSSPDRKSVV